MYMRGKKDLFRRSAVQLRGQNKDSRWLFGHEWEMTMVEEEEEEMTTRKSFFRTWKYNFIFARKSHVKPGTKKCGIWIEI